MKVGPITFQNAILCEDIRQEKNDKLLLIGVFGGSLLLEKMPVSVPLAVYLDGVVPSPGQYHIQIRYSGPGKGSALMEAGFETTEPNEPVLMPLPRLEVLMECEGTFKISARTTTTPWKTLLKKEVIKREGLWSLSSIVSELPSEQSRPAAPEPSSPPEPSRPSSPKRRQRS